MPSAPLTVIPFEPMTVSPAKAGRELIKITSVSAISLHNGLKKKAGSILIEQKVVDDLGAIALHWAKGRF